VKCPNCQFESPEAQNFCGQCGAKLGNNLPQRPGLFAVPGGAKPSLFYGSISQQSSPEEKMAVIKRYLPNGLLEKILAQKDKIEGERKQVTVLFCDMENYTPLVDTLGPENAFSLMDHIYEILIHRVHDYEGTVNSLTGDGIMALFGVPVALEDAAQRAVLSALSIQREMAQFRHRDMRLAPIRMRIGINTGPVVVGSLGNDLRVEFAAVGDTVNLASRMEGLAEAGTVYVTEKTYKLTENLFHYQALGKMEVKGKKAPIPVYKVLSQKKDVYRPRLGAERMIYSTMVGRDKELDMLELQVMKAVNGEGSIVNIVGEAGIGKSRLIAELKKREVIKKVTLFEGRALSMGRNLSFHPVIDFLKQWARIGADDGEAKAFAKLKAAATNLSPNSADETLPFIATLMGMQLSGRYAERIAGIEGEALEKLILKSVRELLIQATGRATLALVTEDLHWADTSSIELMESLFRLAETRKILFINLFRPGYAETGERITETLRERHASHYVEIELQPLDERMSQELVSNMLNGVGTHHSLTEEILRRAGGNPFFLEEIVRSFMEERATVHKNGALQTTGGAVPNTVNDWLMARMDRLEEKTRYLLKVAAVMGRSFFYRILVDVADSVDDIDDRLRVLKEKQFVRERKNMGEVEYFFKHALAQETAYEYLLSPQRRELHLNVARSIEKIFRARLHEFYGMLAYHYGKGESLEKTKEYLEKAGAEALRCSASNEALHFYREALDLYLKQVGSTAEPAKVAVLEKNIALALYNRGQYEEAVEYFDRALDYYWEKPRLTVLAPLRLLSSFLGFLTALCLPSLKFKKDPSPGDAESVELYYKKCKALAIIDPRKFFMESLYICGEITRFDLTKLESGLEMFMGASSLFSFTGLSFCLSRKILDTVKPLLDRSDPQKLILYDFLDTIHNYFEGNWKDIKGYDDELVKRTLDMGGVYDASQHAYWHGLIALHQGELDLAESMTLKLNHMYETYENEFSLLLKYELNAALLMERRSLPEALDEVERGIALARKAGLSMFLFDLYSYKALIHLLLEEMDKSGDTLRRADEIRPSAHAVPIQLASFYRSKMEYDLYALHESLERGETTPSSQRKTALQTARLFRRVSRKAAEHRVESYRLSGLCRWRIHKREKALSWWRKAIEEGERLGARLELARTFFEVGKRMLEAADVPRALNGINAEEYLKRAERMFEAMNLQWDLDELSRVSGLNSRHRSRPITP